MHKGPYRSVAVMILCFAGIVLCLAEDTHYGEFENGIYLVFSRYNEDFIQLLNA